MVERWVVEDDGGEAVDRPVPLALEHQPHLLPDDSFAIIELVRRPDSPACNTQKAKEIEGVKDVRVEITFEPPWDQEMMSEAAKLELGFL